MPTYKNADGIMWGKAILTFVGNAIGAAVPIFIKAPIIQNLIHPFTTSVFLMEALFFLLPSVGFDSRLGSAETGGMICILFVVVCAMFDVFLPSSKEPENNGETAASTVPASTAPTQEQPSKQPQQDNQTEGGSGGKPSLKNMGNFKIFTAIVIVFMWLCVLMYGISIEAVYGVNWNLYKQCVNLLGKDYCEQGNPIYYKDTVNSIFVCFFHFMTLQYVFGMWVMNDAPPLWLYLVYMIPMAVINPLGMIISFYSHRATVDLFNATSCFKSFMAGILCYIGFRMMFQFQEFFKGDADMKNRGIQIGVLAFGFLWMIFIQGIGSM